MRVLVIEDHLISRTALQRLFRQEGYDCHVAATLAHARELCQEHSFYVLICDLSLPDGDAEDLVSLARAHGSPAIAVTGISAPEEINRNLQAGFARFLLKPVDLHTLVTAVSDVTSPNGKQVRDDGPRETLSPSLPR